MGGWASVAVGKATPVPFFINAKPVGRLCALVLLALPLLHSGAAAAQDAAAPSADRGRPLIVAAGAVTGLYYPAAGAICRLMNQERVRHGYRCLVEATSGPVYNVNALHSGEVDVALVQSDWQRMAYQGEGRFAAAGPFAELRAVASLHAEALVLVARPEAGLTGLSDIKGKRVNHGPRGSALRNLVDLTLSAVGLSDKDDEAAELAPDEAVTALCEGDLDALFLAVGHPNGALARAIAACGATPVPLAGPALDKLLEEHKELIPAKVPAALYPGMEDDVATIGVAATLLVRADADAGAVTELVTILTGQQAELARQHPLFSTVTGEMMAQLGRTAPLHPAAEKAYADAAAGRK